MIADLSVAAIVLAAGTSSRMGEANKLLAPIDGEPLIRRVVNEVNGSSANPVIVVTGHQADDVQEALRGCNVQCVHNDHFADGLSTSLRCGLNALSDDVAGAIICLGDMPKLKDEHIDELINAFQKYNGDKICVPMYHDRQGNPVVWPRAFFPEMKQLDGDAGAKKLIGAHRDWVVEIAIDDDGVVRDIDTPDDLKKLKS